MAAVAAIIRHDGEVDDFEAEGGPGRETLPREKEMVRSAGLPREGAKGGLLLRTAGSRQALAKHLPRDNACQYRYP